MPVTVTEKLDSRRSTTGDNPSAELVYTVRGTDSDMTARAQATTASPATYDGMPRQSVTVEPIGYELWDATVRYAPDSQQQSTPPQTGESTFAFDTGGGTQHITQSKETVNTYAVNGTTAPDFQGAMRSRAWISLCPSISSARRTTCRRRR